MCGLRWVEKNARKLDVALIAFNRPDPSFPQPSTCASDEFHAIICRIVAAGVTVVAAAGNQKRDASFAAPARFDEVITVGALADFDGAPGGLAQSTCGPGIDDGLADFSNTGAVVDLLAPGVCIETTHLHGKNSVRPSGTSLSAAHVAGAAARYLSCHPNASPIRVREALVAAAEPLVIEGVSYRVASVASICLGNSATSER
jgi:Subtilase family.